MHQTYQGILKPNFGVSSQPEKLLSRTDTAVMGRDKSCQILLEEANPLHRGVSGRHAEIRPLAAAAPNGEPLWQICDLNSTNGTYINGQRLYGCQTLRSGDKICLDLNGPEFIFKLKPVQVGNQAGAAAIQSGDPLRLSQILPIVSTGKDLFKKAYLIPGVATVLLVIALFAFQNFEPACPNTLINPLGLKIDCYSLILGTYFCFACVFLTYLLCGKAKPWWMLLGAALLTIFILLTPLSDPFFILFRQVLPGGIPGSDFFTAFIRNFFGAGLLEELLKALPVFGAFYLGLKLKTPWRERCGIWEPLDGILIGVASAVGFVYIETLGQYINFPLCDLLNIAPESCLNAIREIQRQNLQIPENVQIQASFSGLKLIIPRIIGAVSGHAAWSGYLGYAIGLGVLKPKKRWQVIGICYLTVAAIHALWNSIGALSGQNQELMIVLQALVGICSYVFLVAAILKARQLSPLRAQNFATHIIGPQRRP